MFEPAAIQEHDKERQSQGRNRAIEKWEVRFCDTGIETKQSSQPEQKQDPTGAKPLQRTRAESCTPEVDREPGQANEQHDVEDFPKTGDQGVVKQESEIFRPALNHCGRCAVHAGAEGVRRVAKTKAHFAALGEESEFHVLENAIGDCGVSAEAAICFALDEQELAVGGGDALVGVGDFGRWICQGEFREDERHESALRKSGDELAGRVAQHSCLVTGGFVDGAVKIAGFVDGVGVGEQDPSAASLAGSGPDGVVLPGPAFLELGGLKDSDAGKAAGDFGGFVCRVIVDHDQVPVAAELKEIIGLRDKRLQAGGKVLFFVAGGNDDGEFDQRVGFGLIENCAGEDGNGERLTGIIGKTENRLEASCARFD